MKRFQECNSVVKIWRYRHYIYIPFKWLWYKYIKPFNIIDDQTLEQERIEAISFRELFKAYFESIEKIGLLDSTKLLFNGGLMRCNLWGLLKGIAQGDMKWYWTHEEVRSEYLGKMMADDEADGLY